MIYAIVRYPPRMADRTARRPGSSTEGEEVAEVPPALARLWRRAARPRRSRRRTLHLEGIVAAAIQLVDREGLPALSMARLAQRLGCAPMSLYRHVANKDELLALMMDAAPGAPPAIGTSARAWRGELERWTCALHEVYLRHPWILEITAGRPPLEPGQLAWLEAGLRALAGTPLSAREQFAVLMALLYYVRGQTQTLGAASQGAHAGAGSVSVDGYGLVLEALVDAERFPALCRLIEAGVFRAGDDEGDATSFEFGLTRLLDGVEALVRSRV